jgi:hypothetical protein
MPPGERPYEPDAAPLAEPESPPSTQGRGTADT